MASPIVRQRMGIDEAIGVKTPSPISPQNPRTPNWYDVTDPNWEKPLEQFELGNYNSIHQIGEVPLSGLLALMGKQTDLLTLVLTKFMDLLTKALDKK